MQRTNYAEELIDYSKFQDIFSNIPKKVGPRFSEFDIAKTKYAIENALDYKERIQVPVIKGLTKKYIWKAPTTVNWFRRTVFYEKSGTLSVLTRPMVFKLAYWSFYFYAVWGVTQHVTHGIWKEKNELFLDNKNIYDKLHNRKIPFNVIWSRPG